MRLPDIEDLSLEAGERIKRKAVEALKELAPQIERAVLLKALAVLQDDEAATIDKLTALKDVRSALRKYD